MGLQSCKVFTDCCKDYPPLRLDEFPDICFDFHFRVNGVVIVVSLSVDGGFAQSYRYKRRVHFGRTMKIMSFIFVGEICRNYESYLDRILGGGET